LDEDDPAETLDDSLLRAVAAAPPIPVPRDLATFALLEPGTVIDDAFRIDARLGAGGMGVVYAARDLKLDREVALKLMRVDRGPAQLGAKLPDVFEREARATARLNHPNIVTLHQFGNWNGLLYLVLERLRGETLNARMERGDIPFAERLRIVEQVARALVHTHAAGITHRDLKPQNVFLLADGGVKVLDFGVSGLGRMHEAPPPSSLRPTRTRSTLSLAGTPGYMAPEQWDGAPCGPQTDLFAVGVILYQLVTGALPYGIGPVELSARPPRLDGKLPAEAADLGALVASCLEPRAPARLADANELVARLQAIRAAVGDVDGPAVKAERGALATARVRGKSSKRIAVALAGAAITIGALLTILARDGGGDSCSQAARLAGVWDAPTRERLATHFGHSPTWDAISRVVDTYTGQWVPLRESACRANDKPAQTCLDQRFVGLTRYLDQVRTRKPEFALTAARSLPAVADCADPDYLARLAHPEQPMVRDPRAAVPYALTVGGLGSDIVHAATFVDGELVIAGFASSETTIAGVKLDALASGEDRFGYVARIGRDGRVRWVQIADQISVVVLATSGDAVVVGGLARPNARLAGVALPTPRGVQDGLLAALDGKTGAVRWTRALESTPGAPMVRGLRSDAEGNLYALGAFAGTATFGGTDTIAAGNAESVLFVASYRPDGSLRWVQPARSDSMSAKAWGIAVDGDSVVFGAWLRGSATFGGHTIGDKGSCAIARLARDTGKVVWVRHERGINGRCMLDAVAMRGDRVAISGRYLNGTGGFVAELALADGAMRWTQPLGVREHDTPKALAFAPDGTLVAGGHFSETLDSGVTLTSNGNWDGFLAAFDKTGKPLGAFGLGGAGAAGDLVRWIVYGPEGELVVGGRFDTTMRVADRTLRGVAGNDGYVVELSPSLITPAPSLPASSASP
jgi:outer membrane protein assembly factor BamB